MLQEHRGLSLVLQNTRARAHMHTHAHKYNLERSANSLAGNGRAERGRGSERLKQLPFPKIARPICYPEALADRNGERETLGIHG